MATILLVDDSNLTRKTLRKLLEPIGHQIIEASNGELAIERYTQDKPDLIFLDMIMNGMSGMEVLERLREIDKDVTVIVASADIQKSTQRMAREAGAKGYITKPFLLADVLTALESVLTGSK